MPPQDLPKGRQTSAAQPLNDDDNDGYGTIQVMGDNIHVLSEVMGFLVSGGEGGGSENYKETDLSLPIKTPSSLLSSIEHTAKYVVVDTTHNQPLQRDILQLLLLHLLLLLLMLNPFTITQH